MCTAIFYFSTLSNMRIFDISISPIKSIFFYDGSKFQRKVDQCLIHRSTDHRSKWIAFDTCDTFFYQWSGAILQLNLIRLHGYMYSSFFWQLEFISSFLVALGNFFSKLLIFATDTSIIFYFYYLRGVFVSCVELANEQ